MITVGITTFNVEKYLPQFLDSLFLQSYQDFEIIIVDDCSTDNTLSILEEYKNKYLSKKIEIISMDENSGAPSYTRNKILDCGKVNGDYLIFLDGDDYLEKDFLQKLYSNIIENNSDISICGFDRFDDETNKIYSKEMINLKYNYLIKNDFDDRLCFINASLWNKLIKYDCIKNIRFKDVRGPEDSLFTIELYQYINSISFINEILIHYRVRYNSVVNASLETVHKYSNYLLEIKKIYESNDRLDVLVLYAFIHLGLSLTFRLYNNKNVDIDKHLLWTRDYFDANFENWRKLKYLNLFYAFSKHGIKGLGLWVCRLLYKLNMFKLFLIIYSTMIDKLKIDIKW